MECSEIYFILIFYFVWDEVSKMLQLLELGGQEEQWCSSLCLFDQQSQSFKGEWNCATNGNAQSPRPGITLVCGENIRVHCSTGDRLCGLVIRVPGYRSRGPWLVSWRYQPL
jgi:hypothetical protein